MFNKKKLEEQLENIGAQEPAKKVKLGRTKHLLGVLGLGSGTGLAEIDALDRLNDLKVVTTPTSVSYTPGGYDLLGQLANNPIYHDFSHFLVTTGISGGPNNTLGILAATTALLIGGLSAKSYIKNSVVKKQKQDKNYSDASSNRKMAVGSLGLLAGGIYIGSQSFLPVVNDALYNAPMSSLGYATAGVVGILGGVYLGIEYLRAKYSYKNKS